MDRYKNFGILPKWPQCVIWGEKVTIDQAKEILSRTDSFFAQGPCSNNHEWDEEMKKYVKFPDADNYITKDNTYDWDAYWADKSAYRKNHKIIPLDYLDNNYISSCYIEGVNGWCHPNGDIFFNKNVGKYPTWEDLESDCKNIAKAFPFLNMKVCLFNGEMSEEDTQAIGGFVIANGKVSLLKKTDFLSNDDPKRTTEFWDWEKTFTRLLQEKYDIFGEKTNVNILTESGRETFFSQDEFKEYFKEYYHD